MSSSPNKPAAGNAGIASRVAIGHHWPGVPEPDRSAASSQLQRTSVAGKQNAEVVVRCSNEHEKGSVMIIAKQVLCKLSIIALLGVGMPALIALQGRAAQEAENVRFGAIIERTINEVELTDEAVLLDLDTGEFYSPDADESDAPDSTAKLLGQAIERGSDVYYENAGEGRTLYGMDMLALPIGGWAMRKGDDATAERVCRMIQRLEEWGNTGTPVLLSGRGKLPVTYVFSTSRRGRGVLQITNFEKLARNHAR